MYTAVDGCFLDSMYYIHKQYFLAGSISAAPENITVTFLNPTSVKVSWQTSVDQLTPIEKYDVTYKPTDARYVYGFRNLYYFFLLHEKLKVTKKKTRGILIQKLKLTEE